MGFHPTSCMYEPSEDPSQALRPVLIRIHSMLLPCLLTVRISNSFYYIRESSCAFRLQVAAQNVAIQMSVRGIRRLPVLVHVELVTLCHPDFFATTE